MAAVAERNQDATVYVGGLDDKVTEHLLAELFIQGNYPRFVGFQDFHHTLVDPEACSRYHS